MGFLKVWSNRSWVTQERLAAAHHKRSTIKWWGWVPWTHLYRQSCEQYKAAHGFHDRRRAVTAVREWKAIAARLQAHREATADSFARSRALKVLLIVLQENVARTAVQTRQALLLHKRLLALKVFPLSPPPSAGLLPDSRLFPPFPGFPLSPRLSHGPAHPSFCFFASPLSHSLDLEKSACKLISLCERVRGVRPVHCALVGSPPPSHAGLASLCVVLFLLRSGFMNFLQKPAYLPPSSLPSIAPPLLDSARPTSLAHPALPPLLPSPPSLPPSKRIPTHVLVYVTLGKHGCRFVRAFSCSHHQLPPPPPSPQLGRCFP